MFKVITFNETIKGLDTEQLMGPSKTDEERAFHYEKLLNFVSDKYKDMKFVQYIHYNGARNPLFVFYVGD